MNSMIILIIFRLLCACILSLVAGYLAFYDKDGWGWFILAAILMGCITISDKE